MLNKLLLITVCTLTVACANEHNALKHATTKGDVSKMTVKIPVEPEHLINLSQEVVTFSLANNKNITEMVNWVSNFPPSRVHINCSKEQAMCKEAQLELKKMGVKHHHVVSNKNNVTLIYEKTLARDCTKEDLSYRAKQVNYVFGCANATNIVRMVSDHQQFVKPAKLAASDADTSKYSNLK